MSVEMNELLGHHDRHAHLRPPALPHVGRGLRGDGRLREVRLRRGRHRGGPGAGPVRAGGGGGAACGRGHRRAARARAAGRALGAGHGRRRLRDAGRALLPGARADGRLAARARPLHLPGVRARGRGAARARARDAAPGPGARRRLGGAMGLGAALAYTTYILVGDRVLAGTPPLALSALVCTGATVTFALVSLPTGGPELGFAAEGWGWLAAIALVSTVGAVIAFFAGLERVGPSAAAILSTLEPVVTVGLAAAAFGESLAGVQLLGAALVLAAVVVMQLPARERRRAWRPAGATSTAAGVGDRAE